MAGEHTDALGEALGGLQRDRPKRANHALHPYLRRLIASIDEVDPFHSPESGRRVELDQVYAGVPVTKHVSIKVEAPGRVTSAWLQADSDDEKAIVPADPWLLLRAQSVVDGVPHRSSQYPDDRAIFAPPWYPGTHMDFLRLDAFDCAAADKQIALVGPPGSGKSTFCKFLALAFAQYHLDEAKSGSVTEALNDWPNQLGFPIPVYVQLRHFFSVGRALDPASVLTERDVLSYLEERFGLGNRPAELRSLEEALESGNAVFLLDGMDEIPLTESPDAIAQRREQLESLIVRLRNVFAHPRLILTCRDYAYEAWAVDGFERSNIAALTARDARRLIERLCQLRHADPRELEREVSALTHAMESVPVSLRDFPLFLSLMAAVYWDDPNDHLPKTKAKLYERSIALLLQRWSADEDDASLYVQLNCTVANLLERVEYIAFRTHETSIAGVEDASDIDFPLLVTELFRMGNAINTHAVLAYLSEHAGVLIAREPETFAFAHRGFQEYLAGAWLLRVAKAALDGGSPEQAFDGVRLLIDAQPLLWREPVQLLAEMLATGARPDDLWRLETELLGLEGPHPASTTENAWSRWAAARVHLDHGLHLHVGFREAPIQSEVRRVCGQLIALDELGPAERRDAAMVLGRLGDDRSGVGLTDDGAPSHSFCQVGPFQGVRVGTSPRDARMIAAEKWARGWSFNREEPGFEVTLSPYRIANYPTTEMQYRTFLRASDGYVDDSWWSDDAMLHRDLERVRDRIERPRLDNLPASDVSWYEALAYCRWFANRTGLPARLPTEVEWEAACRPDGRFFPWGDEYERGRSNGKDEGFARPLPVGCFRSTPAGNGQLFDMAGNTWEWCSTAATNAEGDDFPYECDQENRERLDLGPGAYRVVRGGSFVNPPFLLRTAYRGRDLPTQRATRIGFRVLVDGW